MELNIIIDYLIISIIASMAINSVLRNIAKKNKVLVDIPVRSRKFHKRATPLTGGLAIMLSVIISGELYLDLNDLKGYIPVFTFHLMVASVFLVIFFLADDYKSVSPTKRIIFQSLLSFYMIFMTDVKLSNLGNILIYGDLYLGLLSVPFTIFCAVGLMNAFNMIDGINGLCSGTAMLALLFIGFNSGLIYDSMLVLIIGSMIGFLLFNLRIFGKKRGVFLGDHGSNLIGFWVAWCAIYSSQNELYDMEPMTMIWCVAIPLLDCIGLMISRITKGKNWATGGMDHIHHKLLNKYSPEITLLLILTVSITSCAVGVLIENNYPIWVSTICFLIFSIIYYIFAYGFRLKKIRRG